MKSCKTVWPALEPSGPLRSRLARFAAVRPASKPSDGFKTVRVLHWSLTYILHNIIASHIVVHVQYIGYTLFMHVQYTRYTLFVYVSIYPHPTLLKPEVF